MYLKHSDNAAVLFVPLKMVTFQPSEMRMKLFKASQILYLQVPYFNFLHRLKVSVERVFNIFLSLETQHQLASPLDFLSKQAAIRECL